MQTNALIHPSRRFVGFVLALASALVLGLLNPSFAAAQNQTNACETVLQFGTGTSTSGAKLRPGSTDPFFQGLGAIFPTPGDAFVLTDPPTAWIANSTSADSQWIGPSSSVADDAAGVYIYYLPVVMPCAGGTLTGRYAASDRGAVRLNGASVSFPTPATGSTTWTTFSFNNLLSGLNRLEFIVTNSQPAVGGPPGPTGLRAELTTTATCCACIELSCPSDVVLNPCSNGATANFSITGTNRCSRDLSINCNLASITGVPVTASTVFPVGTSTVICTASDTAGHRTNCSFRVVVRGDTQRPDIRCPQDIVYLCRDTGTNVYFNPLATDDADPTPTVTCLPPSGSFFPVGTNTVTCEARDHCGRINRCSFNVVLLRDGFTKTLQAGVADDFAMNNFESPDPGPCLGASGYWTALPFDTYFPGRHFSHSFQGLPNNVTAARLILRMKPRLPSSQDDMLRIGLQSCGGAGVWGFEQLVASLPGAGGTWWYTNPPVTFTLDLAALPGGANLLAGLNANHRLEFAVGTETLVDYAQLELTYCGPQSTFSGVPYSSKDTYPVHLGGDGQVGLYHGVGIRWIDPTILTCPVAVVTFDLALAPGIRLGFAPGTITTGSAGVPLLCDELINHTGQKMTFVPAPNGAPIVAIDMLPGTNFNRRMMTIDPSNLAGTQGTQVEVWQDSVLISRYFFPGPGKYGVTAPANACVASMGFAGNYWFADFTTPQDIDLDAPEVPGANGIHLTGQVGRVITGNSVRLYYHKPLSIDSFPSSMQVSWISNTLNLSTISLLSGEAWIEAFGPQQLTVSDAIHSLALYTAFPSEICAGVVDTLNTDWTVELNGTADFCTANSFGELVCTDGYLDVKIKLGEFSPGGTALRLTPTALPFDDCHMECFSGGPPNSLTIHRMVGGSVTLNNVSTADFSNWPLALHGDLLLEAFDVTLPANTVVTVGALTYNANGVTFHRTPQSFLDHYRVCLQTTFLPGISSPPPKLSFKSLQIFGGPSIAPDCLTLTCPTNVIVNATSASGAVVRFNPTGATRCGSNVVVTCTPPSGSVFPPGISVVYCSANDNVGSQDDCRFIVTVNALEPLHVRPLRPDLIELRWVGDALVEVNHSLNGRWREHVGVTESNGVERVRRVIPSAGQSFFRLRQ